MLRRVDWYIATDLEGSSELIIVVRQSKSGDKDGKNAIFRNVGI